MVSRQLFRGGEVVALLVWWSCGMCSMMSSNGAFFIVVLGQVFSMYCANSSHLFQSSWYKMCKYCTRCWLVCSDCPSVWGCYTVLMFFDQCPRFSRALLWQMLWIMGLSQIWCRMGVCNGEVHKWCIRKWSHALITGDEDGHFRESVCYCKYDIISVQWREFNNEVKCYWWEREGVHVR